MNVYLDVLFMDLEAARGHWLSRLAWWGLLLTRFRPPQFVHVMCRYRIVGDDNRDYHQWSPRQPYAGIYPWVNLSPWGFNFYNDDEELATDVTLDTTDTISVFLGSIDSVNHNGRLVLVDKMLPVVEPNFNPQTPAGAVRFYVGVIMTALGISRWSHQFSVCTDPVWWRLTGRVSSYGHLTPDALRWFIENEIYQVFW